jgi:hypothetical protein
LFHLLAIRLRGNSTIARSEKRAFSFAGETLGNPVVSAKDENSQHKN